MSLQPGENRYKLRFPRDDLLTGTHHFPVAGGEGQGHGLKLTELQGFSPCQTEYPVTVIFTLKAIQVYNTLL